MSTPDVPTSMRAAVRHRYGSPDLIHVESVAVPKPGPRDVLVRVRGASVNLGDWELLTGVPTYITVLARLFAGKAKTPVPRRAHDGPLSPKYRILGTDVAGEIAAVGSKVTRFKVGDAIYGDCAGFGSFAEYIRLPETAPITHKPEHLSWEVAAAIPQATHIAVHGLCRQAKLKQGQSVLINGGGGGAGTIAIQLAKSLGADVTAIDGPTKLDVMRALGADHVFDYTTDDFTSMGKTYDVILDMAAYKPMFDCRRCLKRGGMYLMGGGSGIAMAICMFLGPLLSVFDRRHLRMLLASSKTEALDMMAALIEKGDVTPHIDSVHPLERTGDALRLLGEKRSVGKVVVVP